MRWNLAGGLPTLWQDRMPTLIPFWEHFQATYKIIFRTCRGREQVCLGSERTTERTGEPGRMQVLKTWWCNAHDDMIRCNTQAKYMTTTANNWRTPGTSVSGHYNTPQLREDLVPRSRMAPEGKWKRKRRGKTKLLLWQTSETKKPWKVEQIERKNTMEMNEVENTLLEKRNKEEQFLIALWLKRDTRLDRMKRIWAKGHNTPVKWISTTRTWSSHFEMMIEKSNITMPPEQKNRRLIIEIGEWRRKCQLLPQKSLKRHL